MNRDALTVRPGLTSTVVKPSTRVVLRKKIPRWEMQEQTVTVVSGVQYQEEADMYDDGASQRCYIGATGDFLMSFGGWYQAIPGDSFSAATKIAKLYAPSAIGDTVYGDNFYIFSTTVDGTAGTHNLSTSPITWTPAAGKSPVLYSRPGIRINSSGNYVIYYQSEDKHIYAVEISPAGAELSITDLAGTEVDHYESPMTIAPIDDLDAFTYYYDSATRMYRLDHYKNGTVASKNKAVNYHRDDFRTGLEHHFFDAVKIDSMNNVIVTNSSAYGNSKLHYVYGTIISEPHIILPSDDVDWTGTLMVSSLEMYTIDGVDKLFAVASQRFLQSNDEYSSSISTVLWALVSDQIHWSQSRYHALTTRTINGKVNMLGDSVYVLSPATSILGQRTHDFGGSGSNVQYDVSNTVTSWSIEMSPGNASMVKHKLSVAEDEMFETSDWIKMADEVVTYIGDGTDEAQIMVSQVISGDYKRTVDSNIVPLVSRGPIGEMVRTVQFTDEILTRAIDDRYEMDQNSIVNHAGSTWKATNTGLIQTEWANKNDEAMVMNASPIRSRFSVRAQIKHDENAPSFGIIFWADTGSYLSGGDYMDHNFYLFAFEKTDDPNVRDVKLYRRYGTRNAAGTWTDHVETIRQPGTVTLPYGGDGNYYTVEFVDGRVRILYNDVAAPILEWWVSKPIPKEFLCGVYAKVLGTRSTGDNSKGDWVILVEDISDWDASGSIVFGDDIYSYTKDNNTQISLGTPLKKFLPKGSSLLVNDSKTYIDWLQVNSSDNRYSVADVFRHISARAGVTAIVDRAFEKEDMDTIHGAYTVDGDGNFVLSSETLLLSDEYITNGAVEIEYAGFYDGDMIGVRMQAGLDSTGFSIRINRIDAYTFRMSLIYDDGTTVTEYMHGYAFRVAIEGKIRVVVKEGYAHVYANGNYVGSLFSLDMLNLTWKVGVEGEGITIKDVIVEAGADSMLPGIWDSTTQAKRVINDMLKGRPLTYVDNNDGTVRVMKTYTHDDVGELSLDVAYEIGHGKTWEQPGSAMLLQGGYDWSVSFNENMLPDVGLIWENRQNHTLMSPKAMLEYAKVALALNEGKINGYAWVGRLDPVLTPLDTFHISAFGAMPEGDYVIDKLALLYSSTEKESPKVIAKGTSHKKEIVRN